MAEGKNVKATDAAERKAEELNVDLADVKGTGADGAIKVEDVERAAQEAAADEAKENGEAAAEDGDASALAEASYEARINPEFTSAFGAQEYVLIDGKEYRDGTPFTDSEYEAIKGARSPATVEHPDGVQYVKKGRKLTP